MTQFYITPIPASAPGDAATFNIAFGQADAAIHEVITGARPTQQANWAAATALTIASDAITVTKTRHRIDTEGSASQDNLVTINGGVAGDVLILQITNAARVVDVQVSGNIRTFSGAARRLDDPSQMLLLVFDSTTNTWNEVGIGAPLKGSNYNNFLIGASQLAVQPAPQARNSFRVKAAAGTVDANGVAAPTASGTISASNDTDSTYVNAASVATINTSAGYISPTFNLVRRQHNPIFHVVMRTGADLTLQRYWLGLFSAAAPLTADTLGTVQAIGFRYSTSAGDAGWVGITGDGATQQVTGALGGALVANTRYLLSFEVSPAGVVTFRVNNVALGTISANLPAATTELGFVTQLVTLSAAIRQWKFSRMYCEYD